MCGRLGADFVIFEGMRNEKIVSSFIYVSFRVNRKTLKVLTATQYYDSENITESRLSFRMAIYDPPTHGRNDDFCPKVLYDMERCAN